MQRTLLPGPGLGGQRSKIGAVCVGPIFETIPFKESQRADNPAGDVAGFRLGVTIYSRVSSCVLGNVLERRNEFGIVNDW